MSKTKSKTIHIKASVSLRLDSEACISEIYGQGCNYRTKFGVSNLIVLIGASVEMNNKAYNFICRYENEARTDNIRAYNGIDMESSDNQRDLFKLLENEDFHKNKVFFNEKRVKSLSEVQVKLMALAQNEAIAFFEENIVNILNFDDIQEKVIDEFKKYTDFHLFDDKKIEEIIYEECENIIKDEYYHTIDDEDDNDVSITVTENGVFFDLVNKALEIAEEEYLEMGETDLNDEELLENLENIDLIFINIYERALQEATSQSNKSIYVAFHSILYKLLYNEDTTVNVWHIEQNELSQNKKTAKQLCYRAAQNLIASYLANK